MMRYLMLYGFLCSLAAQARIDLSVDRTQVNVGDALVVTVDYRWPHDYQADARPLPAEDFAAAGAFLSDIPPAQDASDGSEQRLIQRLTILATASGAWALPRPSVQLRSPDGELHTVQAPEVIVHVGEGSEEPQLPEPLAPWDPRQHTPTAPSLWWWLAPALALSAGLAWWWFLPRTSTPPRPPEARFHDELLLARSSVEGKHAATLLSLALRRYLGACYHFDGAAATVNECRRALEGALASEQRYAVLRILEQLDGLRFSAPGLDSETVSPFLAQADAWVQANAHARAEALAAAQAKAGKPS